MSDVDGYHFPVKFYVSQVNKLENNFIPQGNIQPNARHKLHKDIRARKCTVIIF